MNEGQGHRDLHYENNKCWIISEILSSNAQAMPIKFAGKIVRLKVYNIIFASPMNLTVAEGQNSNFFTWSLSRTVFKLWHSNLA